MVKFSEGVQPIHHDGLALQVAGVQSVLNGSHQQARAAGTHNFAEVRCLEYFNFITASSPGIHNWRSVLKRSRQGRDVKFLLHVECKCTH